MGDWEIAEDFTLKHDKKGALYPRLGINSRCAFD